MAWLPLKYGLLGGGHHSDIMPVTNMVFTVEALSPIDLYNPRWLALTEYTPPGRRFPGACLRLRETYLIFSSGKIVINKCKSTPDVGKAEYLLNISLTKPKLSHMSGSMKVGKVNLPVLYELVDGAEYEPEIHSGLLFKIGKVSVIVYHTGTVMYCGMRSCEHLERIEEEIVELIDNYRVFAG